MSRFADLVSLVPSGSFYGAAGQIVPYREVPQPAPYEYIFEGVVPGHVYEVYANAVAAGRAVGGVDGNAIVRVPLVVGRNDIVIVDVSDGSRFRAYLDVRTWGTFLSALASVVEAGDSQLDDIQRSLSLSTATTAGAGVTSSGQLGYGYLEEVYGQPLSAPNDVGFSTETYRAVLTRLRQAFRLWGGGLLGLRQVVSAYTGSLPLVVPSTWQPRWSLGTQLVPNGDFSSRFRGVDLVTTPLTNLNARSRDWVHVLYLASAANVFPSVSTADFPTPQAVQVFFAAGWDGGDVVVTGVTALGNVASETFVYVGPGAESPIGQTTWFRVTSVQKTALGGAFSVSVGLATSRFITVVSLERGDTSFTTLAWGPTTLAWGAGELVTPTASGQYTLPGTTTRAAWWSFVFEPGGGFAVGDTNRMLSVELDGLGVQVIDLRDPIFWPNPSVVPANLTMAQIADVLRRYMRGDVRYGAVRATGSFTVTGANGAALVAAASSFVLNDYLNGHGPVTFKYTLGAPTGFVDVVVGAGDTPAQVAVATAAVVNDYLGIEAVVGWGLRLAASSAGAVVNVIHDFGGNLGAVVVSTVGNLSAPSNVAGAASPYVDYALAVTDAPVGAVTLQLRRPNAVTTPAALDSSIRLFRLGGPDGSLSLLGVPHVSAVLSVGASVRARVLDLPSGTRFPRVVTPVPVVGVPGFDSDFVVLHAPFLDTVVSTSGFLTPVRPTALEVFFDAAWRGGVVRLEGVAGSDSHVVTEDFVVGDLSLVLTGTASSVDGVVVVAGVGVSFTTVQPGMCFRLSSGRTAYVRYVVSALVLKLEVSAGMPAFVVTNFEIRKDVLVVGSIVFEGIAGATNLTAAVAPPSGPSGTATVQVADAWGRGYSVRVGRGVRVSGAAGTLVTTDPTHATFTDVLFTGAVHTESVDVGAWILISGSVYEMNNGLHEVVGLSGGPGGAILLLRHREYTRGGYFADDAVLSWSLGSVGEIVRCAGVTAATGDMPILGPGLRYGWSAGALVEEVVAPDLRALGFSDSTGMVVDVDMDMVPFGAASDLLTVVGENLPDGWSTSGVAVQMWRTGGFYSNLRLWLSASGGLWTLVSPTFDVVLHRGVVLRCSFWVQQHDVVGALAFTVSFSWDDGATWVVGDAVPGAMTMPIVGTIMRVGGGVSSGAMDPLLVVAQREVPWDASTCRVRLSRVGAVGEQVSVEKCVVESVLSGSLGLGGGTVALTGSSAHFRSLVYLWSAESLRTPAVARAPDVFLQEPVQRAVGLPEWRGPRSDTLKLLPAQASGAPEVAGVVDRIGTTHMSTSRWDVTEYEESPVASGVLQALNLVGSYDALTWGAATLVNMEFVPRSIAVGSAVGERLGVVRPVRVSSTSVVSSHAEALSAPVDGVVTLTDFDAAFDSSLVGLDVEVAVTREPVNAGTFRVLSASGSVLTYRNPLGVSEPVTSAVYRVVRLGEPLAFVAPSNATLLETSTHVGPDELASPGEVLYASGVPVPSSSFLRTTTVGAGGALSAPDLVGLVTLTDAGPFPQTVVGRSIVFGGQANPANNGTFLVTEWVSPLVIRFENLATLAGAEASFGYTYGHLEPDAPPLGLPWRFLGPSSVQVASVGAGDAGLSFYPGTTDPVYEATASWVLDYARLLRVTASPLDLGVDFESYRWFVDAVVWRRTEPSWTVTARTEGLLFQADYTARLSSRSDGDRGAVTLTADTGLTRTTVSRDSWSFVDAQTIQISSAVFNAGAVYEVTYNALVPVYPRPATVLLEWARSTDGSTWLPWEEVVVDQLVAGGLSVDTTGPYQYHWLRATVSGCVDVRDVEIGGLGLRGVRLYGDPPYAPEVV